jgi:hypothetical protein
LLHLFENAQQRNGGRGLPPGCGVDGSAGLESRTMPVVVAAFFVVSLAGHALLCSPAMAAESVRKVLAFDGSLNGVVLPASSAPSVLAPFQCRTTLYTAGAGEVAVVSVAGTIAPSLPSDHDVHLVVTRSVPLSLPVPLNATEQSESMADGTASISAKARVPLTEGSGYQFGAGFSADQETTISTFGCQGVAIIYAPTP